MANKEHLKILLNGVEEWDRWRLDNPEILPDLSGVDLSGANLSGAALVWSNFSRADLSGAKLNRAILWTADLRGAKLRGADLTGADLRFAILNGAALSGANFSGVRFGGTNVNDVDLSGSIGLETAIHLSPSSIGIDTIYQSKGKIPPGFLRDAGVPDILIDYIPSLAGPGFEFYSCFISYSTADQVFAERLHGKMRDAHLRVWFAPEDMKGGDTVIGQLETQIRVFDKLLLVLSPTSIISDWVKTEIRKALKAEKNSGKRKLFPIRLCDFNLLKEWEFYDGGTDLAAKIREYFIPDFSNWKDHDAFESAFARLLKDLRAEGPTPKKG